MSAFLLSDPVDYILLGGQKSPGLATVRGAKDKRLFKDHGVPYATGERSTYLKQELVDFEVLIRCFTSDDLIAFDMWRKIFDAPEKRTVIAGPDSKNDKATKALDIWHPHLEPLRITAVTVREVSQFEPADDTGIWQCVLKLRQFKGLPQQTSAKVDGAIAAPLSEREKLIQRLSTENEVFSEELAR